LTAPAINSTTFQAPNDGRHFDSIFTICQELEIDPTNSSLKDCTHFKCQLHMDCLGYFISAQITTNSGLPTTLLQFNNFKADSQNSGTCYSEGCYGGYQMGRATQENVCVEGAGASLTSLDTLPSQHLSAFINTEVSFYRYD
jgi:hypothetical protein